MAWIEWHNTEDGRGVAQHRHAPAAPAVPCAECVRRGPSQGACAPLLAHAWPEGTVGGPSHQQAPITEPLCAPHRDSALAPRRLRASERRCPDSTTRGGPCSLALRPRG